MTNNPIIFKAQSGVVLFVALIMLLLLSLIATVGMQTTTLEEKMAGNMRNQNLVFQAAESALSAAEATLSPVSPAVLPTFATAATGGFYTTNLPPSQTSCPITTLSDSELVKDCFWTTYPVATSSVTATQIGNRVSTPKYIIQKLATACYVASCPSASDLSQPYKITVRATGSSNTVVILQSVYTP
jgi:type IV pilus assembly protein PilX